MTKAIRRDIIRQKQLADLAELQEAGRRGWGRGARCAYGIAELQGELIRGRLDRGAVIRPGRFGFDLKRNAVFGWPEESLARPNKTQ